jgi:chromosome segregation protein
MRLQELSLSGFKSFGNKTNLTFEAPITAVVGPNGSGKSNVAEALAWVLGEQSMKSLRGKRGEDLIWNGSRTLARQNRARVTLTFDNSNREWPIDFDEVIIGREVYRDGTNQYFINESQVRLRDVYELLSSVSLGSSRHHIISQGEADRILTANPKERRSIIEEALGLSMYHWKIEESEKKLVTTEEHLKEAKSLRRELSGHLRFMEKEAEKITRAEALQKELASGFGEYLHLEHIRLGEMRALLDEKSREPKEKLAFVRARLEALPAQEEDAGSEELRRKRSGLQYELATLGREKGELSRTIGRLEGALEYIFERKKIEQDKALDVVTVTASEAEGPLRDSFDGLGRALETTDFEAFRQEVIRVRERISTILDLFETRRSGERGPQEDVEPLVAQKEEAGRALEAIIVREDELRRVEEEVTQLLERAGASLREREKERFALREEEHALTRAFSIFSEEERVLSYEEEQYARDKAEALVLVGEDALFFNGEHGDISREVQQAKRREIERLKLRLEDIGVPSAEAMAEYESLRARDTFLAKEVLDLEETAHSLRVLMAELLEKLSHDFNEGVSKINKVFSEFFSILFDGGDAALTFSLISKEDEGIETNEPGIEINVNLPRKKVRSLDMLSGGERALTSIALLFAISQINPPPFLVLDETDAALDEANSRKYGDMLLRLADRSQLIVVTHNRETMSRAGILYGVTMSSDGLSRILSVKFEEAVKSAK